MNKQLHHLQYIYSHLLIAFLIGRIGFAVYNHELANASISDVAAACWDGLWSHDLYVVAILLVIPLLISLLTLKWPRFPLRAALVPYYILLGILVGVIVLADAVMYEFWQFKLNSVVLSYAASPEGTTNSVSTSFLFSRALTGIAFIVYLVVPCIWLTPSHWENTASKKTWLRTLCLLWALLVFLGLVTARVGNVYQNRPLFVNHIAVNPILGFSSSFHTSSAYSDRYNYLDDSSRKSIFQELYPAETEDITDTLLTTDRPDILIVLMESMGGKFVKELGGIPDVTPNISRLIPTGIFWENYYSNSFRTDRGTVSAYSGHISYPDVGLMKQTEFHHALPSLARSLGKNNYQTTYLYGGAMTNMGKRQYLEDMNFTNLLDDTAFSPEELNSSWGANDGTSCKKVLQLFEKKDNTEPWFMAYQTLSSHEPWIVPYNRLEDEKLNAFAYTDDCIGHLIDSLQALPAWDNLLVILIPDHGFLYQQNYEDPEFFHSPMLWLGGAIREPRRMDMLMNQSDLCATLLSQLQISHADYPWSRNVLSSNYTQPFVYCNYPAGVMYLDETGTSIFDTTANEVIFEQPSDNGMRVLKAQAILQTSYIQLDQMK